MISLLVLLLLIIIYYILKRNYSYWKSRGVHGPNPTFLVGNFGKCFLMQKSIGKIITELYNKYQDLPFVGAYRGCTPILIIRDPDLIKDITVKSFNNFHDNDIDVDKKVDPIFGRNPFVLRGDEWKNVRSQLTPCFTSGKMKSVLPLLAEESKQLVLYIDKEISAKNNDGLEAKELCSKFTLNNVGSCAFGLEANCFQKENSEFRKLAHEFISPGGWVSFKIFVAQLTPFLTKLFSIRFITKEVENKLRDIVSNTLQYRAENNIIRTDFLHIINQLKETSKDYEFTDLDVTAHAGGFVADGFETSSNVMSFVLFELASNPIVQAKLREEIVAKFKTDDTPITYEALNTELPYLDAVINESLRKNSPVLHLNRLCTKAYDIPATKNNSALTIEAGTSIILPVYGVQNDPEYFSEPKQFQPERFLDKSQIVKGVYMPFGNGPRSCLGQRFALLQIKIGVAYIIKNYELSVNHHTKLPLTFDPVYLLLSPIGGLWLNFKKIA